VVSGPSAAETPRRVAIVLAAGRGVRMRSRRPKVLHAVAGRPAVAWVIDAARRAGCERVLVVVGHGADQVRAAVAGDRVEFVEQREQRGTGDAVLRAAASLEPLGSALALVLSGDAPLIRPETLGLLLREAEAGWGALAVARVDPPAQPGSLGRVIRGELGRLERIVEVADATADELALREVNAGHYALRLPELFDHLRGAGTANAQGELYLTDAVVAAARAGREVRAVLLEDGSEALGINDRRDLARAHRALVARKVDELLASGVTIVDPERVELEAEVSVGEDTVLHPDVALLGCTRIGAGCVIHQGAWLRDCELGDDVEVLPYSVLEQTRVAARCAIGPFARLRGGVELAEGVRIGNFVEVKKSTLGAGVKAAHLAYLGDAIVGDGSNIGAGVVTCNYDGVRKHRTEIGAGVFVGSDTMLVAPVRVGDGAITGAGSVITQDVPAESLGLGRARQRNLVGWRKRRRLDRE
jgi:bifunctional UDP-N-acetylglucosamine pyrophosphorylase/glucosamine-1-phosphate N-acetyltransferase